VLIGDHAREAGLVILDPLDLEPLGRHLVKKAARQDVIVFIILDQENFESDVSIHKRRLFHRQLDDVQPISAQALHDVHE
jgi:hypothetical protein